MNAPKFYRKGNFMWTFNADFRWLPEQYSTPVSGCCMCSAVKDPWWHGTAWLWFGFAYIGKHK